VVVGAPEAGIPVFSSPEKTTRIGSLVDRLKVRLRCFTPGKGTYQLEPTVDVNGVTSLLWGYSPGFIGKEYVDREFTDAHTVVSCSR
jgi:hypothetical protein